MPDQADSSGLPQAQLDELPLHDLVACHECDLLMRKPVLSRGEKAQCVRCGYEWWPRRPGRPGQCANPKCRTALWDHHYRPPVEKPQTH